MKTFFAILISCIFLLFTNLNHARKEPAGEYWRSVMKDEPMPEAIKGLLQEDHHQTANSAFNSEKKMKHFVKDFDSRHSLIIYHNSPESKQEDKTYDKDVKGMNDNKHKADIKN